VSLLSLSVLLRGIISGSILVRFVSVSLLKRVVSVSLVRVKMLSSAVEILGSARAFISVLLFSCSCRNR
jgi:hypothetical protein